MNGYGEGTSSGHRYLGLPAIETTTDVGGSLPPLVPSELLLRYRLTQTAATVHIYQHYHCHQMRARDLLEGRE